MIGRGSAAKLLKQLQVGRKATFKYKAKPGASVAVSGDRPLLLNGVQTVVNDRLMHPRTAVGIDVDGLKLLFLVIDGRSATSRGYTMVELATMMRALGAESALNFDGGGSSTLYSRKVTGEMGLINEPSTTSTSPARRGRAQGRQRAGHLLQRGAPADPAAARRPDPHADAHTDADGGPDHSSAGLTVAPVDDQVRGYGELGTSHSATEVTGTRH